MPFTLHHRGPRIPATLTSSFLALCFIVAGCVSSGGRPSPGTVVQPGAPGESSRVLAGGAPQPAALAPPYTRADVRFMQEMFVHHGQAVDMTGMARTRAVSPAVRSLVQRIEATQDAELGVIRSWLRARNEPLVQRQDSAHQHMPGMLTNAELTRLSATAGQAFERLFLEYMIRHHEGALVMVAELFATDRAGMDPEIFQFATHVDADQRAEVARMRRMLTAITR